MIARRYPAVIEQTGTGYSAYSPDVSGCVAVGDTEEETRWNFQDALIEHFEACVRWASRFRNRTLPSITWK